MKKNFPFYLSIFFLTSLYAQDEDFQTFQKETPKNIEVKSTNINISQEGRKAIIQALYSLLADNYVLYTKALNFHWNVETKLFSQLHAFFKTLYTELQMNNDLLAERIRALGGYSPGSLQEFLQLTKLKENKGGYLPSTDMLRILLEDQEAIIRAVRQVVELSAEYHDWGTNNFLAGLAEKQEKTAWMIRAHLEGK